MNKCYRAECLPEGLSVIVPVYNSAATLPMLVQRIAPVLGGLQRPYELILVDDGSRDESWETVRSLARQHAWIRGIGMMRNFGQHNALLAGLRAARFSVAATMDDDLQHPPEELPKLLGSLEQGGQDVVYGTPLDQPHEWWRALSSRITKLALSSVMGAGIASQVSAYRVLRTPLRAGFSGYDGPFVSLDVLLTWATTRFSSVPVEHRPRASGKSNYTFRKLVQHSLTMMTGFSVRPLQVSSMLGFAFSLFGFAVLAYVIIRFVIEGGRVPGFPFLASIIAIFSGAQMFALGIIGEYLSRMHFQTMNRPPYVIRDEVPERSSSHEV